METVRAALVWEMSMQATQAPASARRMLEARPLPAMGLVSGFVVGGGRGAAEGEGKVRTDTIAVGAGAGDDADFAG